MWHIHTHSISIFISALTHVFMCCFLVFSFINLFQKHLSALWGISPCGNSCGMRCGMRCGACRERCRCRRCCCFPRSGHASNGANGANGANVGASNGAEKGAEERAEERAARHTRALPFLLTALSSLFGSQCVLCAKEFIEIVKAGTEDPLIWATPIPYGVCVALVVCCVAQVHWLNQALIRFDALLVVPVFYVRVPYGKNPLTLLVVPYS